MAWHSLGRVTTNPGTLVRLTANESSPSANRPCHAILIEQWPDNTGKIFIFDRPTGDRTTGVGVVAILAPPTTNSYPSAAVGIPTAPDGLNANDYYLDVTVNGEGPIVSILVN